MDTLLLSCSEQAVGCSAWCANQARANDFSDQHKIYQVVLTVLRYMAGPVFNTGRLKFLNA